MEPLPDAAAASKSPRVSVIIPTYNRAADLGRCLDSLVAQTFKDFEVLVCDDGSTDESAMVVERYKGRLDLSYHWARNFGGPARPRNSGVQLARGMYVAFLDSDDWWSPRKLAESVQRLDADADVVYHDLWIARSPRQRVFWRRAHTRPLVVPVFRDLLLNGNAICNSSVVLRRELMGQVGGFSEDPALIAWEDYDAWLRISKITERFERIEEPLGYYWSGGANLSSPRRLISNLARFREMYGATGRNTPESSLPAWYHYILGLSHYQLGAYSIVPTHMRRALSGRLPIAKRAKAAVTIVKSSLFVVLAAVR